MRWFPKVFSSGSGNDLAAAIQAADHYLDSYDKIKHIVHVPEGTRIESLSSKIPGMVEEHYAYLQDLESILEYLERREKRARSESLKRYMEHYNRQLNHSVAKDYCEMDQDVQDIIASIQYVASARNLYIGLHKSIEALHYQISNITKLRAQGIEDATL